MIFAEQAKKKGRGGKERNLGQKIASLATCAANSAKKQFIFQLAPFT